MKVRLMIIIGVISFLLGGCNKIQKNSNQVQLVQRTEEILVESEDLADDYFNIYKERWNQSNRNSLKLQQDIIEYLGRKNYIAVDINNQIDMVNGELVKKFCKNVQNEVNDSITIISIMESGGFVRYDLNSQNGEIYAICSNMTWDQDAPEAEYINEFQVQSWKYTKNGYFFIEEYDRQGYDGYHGKIGFRVEPLDEACRELNRKYVMPVGYAGNKLFITNWNQSDYSQLDFYDLYEIMYLLKYEKYVPYNYSQEGVEYYIPKQDFEEVIQTFLTVESEVLESNAIYNAETKTYLYRPRGLYEVEYPEYPYSEVVGFTENSDGTITLTVNVVFPYNGDSQVYSHEVVVRPLDNGGVQYVSNRIIPSEDNQEETWYTPRLTEEEWKEIYGGK